MTGLMIGWICGCNRLHSCQPLSKLTYSLSQIGSNAHCQPGIQGLENNCGISRVFTGEGNSTLLQYSCLENPKDGRAWKAAVHGVAEGWTRLSYFTFTFYFHALEKEMATHSSVLAWRIPGTGEPVGLPSMGSHRVRHNLSDLAAAAAAAAAAAEFSPNKTVLVKAIVQHGPWNIPSWSCLLYQPTRLVGLLARNTVSRFDKDH